MSYVTHESNYRALVAQFISETISAESFAHQFMSQWRIDRDAQFLAIKDGHKVAPTENALCKTLDNIFTACDCYAPVPDSQFEIDANQFRREVAQLSNSPWGADSAL